MQRSATHKEHRKRIRSYLKFRAFDQAERALLIEWLKEQQRYDLRRSQLANMGREFLLERRTIIPADSTLDRLVNAEVSRQEKISFRRLSTQLGDEVTKKIDGLLDVEEPSRISTLEWLTEYPPEATPKTTLDYINRLERLLETAMHTVDLRDIRPSMINFCSRLAEKMTVYQLIFPSLGITPRFKWCFWTLSATMKTMKLLTLTALFVVACGGGDDGSGDGFDAASESTTFSCGGRDGMEKECNLNTEYCLLTYDGQFENTNNCVPIPAACSAAPTCDCAESDAPTQSINCEDVPLSCFSEQTNGAVEIELWCEG